MELSEVLNRTGLNEKESKVYLALLELGSASAYAIAPKAGLKRPITYIVLESLMQKGLASQIPKIKKALYTAAAPEKLLREAHQKEELLKRFLPNMEALYNARKEKPQVQLFEGVEGIKVIYQKILEAKEVLFFGTSKEISKLDNPWLNLFMKRVKENNFPVKDILSHEPEDIAYANSRERGPTYEIRFLPKGAFVPADCAIFGDNLVLFSFRPQIFAVMVTSKDISQLLRIMYQMAWQSSEPEQEINNQKTVLV